MKKRWIGIVVLFLIASCSNGAITPALTPGSEVPTPVVKIASVPDASVAAEDFVSRWEVHD